MSEEPGWYPDPYFLELERYWDGREWTEQCRNAETKEQQASIKPRPPKIPNSATPSATAARDEAKAAGAGDMVATAPRAEDTAEPATASAAPTPPPPPTPPTAAPAPAPEQPPSVVPEPTEPDVVAPLAASAAAAVAANERAPLEDAPPQRDVVEADAAGPADREAEPPTADVTMPEPEAPTPSPAVAAPTSDTSDPIPEEPGATEEERARVDKVEPEHEPPLPDDAHEGAPTSKRRRRALIGVGAAVVLIVAVVAIAALSKGGGGASASSQVAQAAAATERQQYAQLNVDVKVDHGQNKAAASAVSGFSANGTYNFGSQLGALTLNGPGNAGTQQMVLDNQTIYLDPNGLVAQLITNKTWVEASPDDLATSSSSGFAAAPTLFQQLVGNPTTLLLQLQERGVTATSVGSTLYQGTPVQVYSVKLSPQAVNLRLQGLPASLRGQLSIGQAAEQVLLTTNGLVRAIKVPITVANNGSTASAKVVVALSSWGTTVEISAPPAAQVVSWAQLKAVLNYTSQLG